MYPERKENIDSYIEFRGAAIETGCRSYILGKLVRKTIIIPMVVWGNAGINFVHFVLSRLLQRYHGRSKVQVSQVCPSTCYNKYPKPSIINNISPNLSTLSAHESAPASDDLAARKPDIIKQSIKDNRTRENQSSVRCLFVGNDLI